MHHEPAIFQDIGIRRHSESQLYILFNQEKIPLLLVEQNVKLALTVAPYAYVLENGRLVMHDTSEKLKENPDIRDFYLGLSDIGERKSFRQVKHYKRRKRWLT